MTGVRIVSALVLDTLAYRDRDLIAKLFSRDGGTFSAMAYGARGSKTRFPTGIDRLTLGEATLSLPTNRMVVCKQFDVQDVYWKIKESLEHTAVATVLSELLMKSHVEEQDAGFLFDFSTSVLTALDSGLVQGNPGTALFVVVRFLQLLGFLPQKLSCPLCNEQTEQQPTCLLSDSGALFCRKHVRRDQRYTVLPENDANLLDSVLAVPELTALAELQVPSEKALSLLRNLTPLLRHLLGGELKSMTFLLEIFE
jgi:DNA repair protein RecO